MAVLITILVVAAIVTLLVIYSRYESPGTDLQRATPESITDLLALLHTFLHVVGETMWSKSGGQRLLESEMDKYRCVHFSFGAIKRLAESTRNRQLGDEFAGIASVQEASYWFGENQAMDVIRRYGLLVNQSDLEVQIPATAGHKAMDRFLVGSPSDLSDGYSSLKDELRLVIQGYSTVQPEPCKLLGKQSSHASNLHQIFESFLELLEVPLLRGRTDPTFATDVERRKSLYFLCGAGHRLAQNATNDEEAGEFYRSVASQLATALFGESRGGDEVTLHIGYMANPENAPAYFLRNLESGHAAMNSYLKGIEGFSKQTVDGIIRTTFEDAIMGDDVSR